MPEASFRLAPNYLKTGEVATLHAERVPAALFEQACTIDLLEVDADDEHGQVLARWTAVIEGGSFVTAFRDDERQAVDADVEGDMELPEPALETSRGRCDLDALFGPVDEILGRSAWLLGDELSVADVAVAAYVKYAQMFFGMKIPESAFPNLARYMADVDARPHFRSTVGGG